MQAKKQKCKSERNNQYDEEDYDEEDYDITQQQTYNSKQGGVSHDQNDDELDEDKLLEQIKSLSDDIERQKRDLQVLTYGRRIEQSDRDMSQRTLIEINVEEQTQYLSDARSREVLVHNQVCYSVIKELALNQIKQSSKESRIRLKNLCLYTGYHLLNALNMSHTGDEMFSARNLTQELEVIRNTCASGARSVFDECLAIARMLQQVPLPSGKTINLLEKCVALFAKGSILQDANTMFSKYTIPQKYGIYCSPEYRRAATHNVQDSAFVPGAMQDDQFVAFTQATLLSIQDLLKYASEDLRRESRQEFQYRKDVEKRTLFAFFTLLQSLRQRDIEQIYASNNARENLEKIFKQVSAISERYVRLVYLGQRDIRKQKQREFDDVRNRNFDRALKVYQQLALEIKIRACATKTIQNSSVLPQEKRGKQLLMLFVLRLVAQPNAIFKAIDLKGDALFAVALLTRTNVIKMTLANDTKAQACVLSTIIASMRQNGLFEAVMKQVDQSYNSIVIAVKKVREQFIQNTFAYLKDLNVKIEKFKAHLRKRLVSVAAIESSAKHYLRCLNNRRSEYQYFFFNYVSLAGTVIGNEEQKYRHHFYRFFARQAIGGDRTFFDELVRVLHNLEVVRNTYMEAFFDGKIEKTEDLYFFKDRLVHISDQEKNLKALAKQCLLNYTETATTSKYINGTKEIDHQIKLLKDDLKLWNQSVERGLNRVDRYEPQELDIVTQCIY